MSMIKQLWIAIAFVVLLALGGSLIVSTLAARHYLEQQLNVKNIDNVNSLALSMSQLQKDPVTLELLLSAQFDAGHYEYIRLTDPEGRPLMTRESITPLIEVPQWFAALIPIEAAEGVAQVQDGWKQFGTLRLKSHSRFVYRSLWDGTLRLLVWFVIGGLACGVLGSILLRRVVRPLNEVVTQALAIGERRFLTIDEPRTLELREVARAMNALAVRVRSMLEEESSRLEEVRRAAQNDAVTGLPNREHFLGQMEAALADDNAAAAGTLAVIRIPELAAVNQQQGREAGDALLRRLADALELLRSDNEHRFCGRLGGSDLALLIAEESDELGALAQELHAAVDIAVGSLLVDAGRAAPIGIAAYRRGDGIAQVLAHADLALEKSSEAGDGRPVIENVDVDSHPPSSAASWQRAIADALDDGRVSLKTFPVVATDGAEIHLEAPVRLRLEPDGPWLTAGEFMPWAARTGLLARVDEAVLDRALELLRRSRAAVCINLSAASICDPQTVERFAGKLASNPELAGRLWIDLPESAAFKHSVPFRQVCARLKPLGCRIGLEHVGLYVCRIGELHDIGLDYLKIGSAAIRGIDGNPGNQTFLRGLATIAHTMGTIVIAEGVASDAEARQLKSIGFDGMTGPGIRAA
ncbi:MAG: EAL domain-containing protein [Rhodocyclaceae bacterium]|nr:EAL domain-containing protein [Rhodocyclaceae bacterium]